LTPLHLLRYRPITSSHQAYHLFSNGRPLLLSSNRLLLMGFRLPFGWCIVFLRRDHVDAERIEHLTPPSPIPLVVSVRVSSSFWIGVFLQHVEVSIRFCVPTLLEDGSSSQYSQV